MQSVTFQYTEADLVDARRFAYYTLPLIRGFRWVLIFVAGGNLLFGAWLAWHGDGYGAMERLGWLLFGLVMLVWMSVGDRWLLPRSVRKSLARNRGLQGDNTLSWDAELFLLQGSHGESRWPWGDLAKWKESPGCFLVYQSDAVYHAAPKRCLSQTQASEIRDHLQAALGPAGKKRK